MAGAAIEMGGNWREEFRELQQKLSGEGGKASPYFQRAAVIMHRDVMSHFNAESSPEGRWVPLKERYGAKREAYAAKQSERRSSATAKLAARKGATGHKILQGEGYLRGSMMFEGQAHNARVFSETIYAGVHNRGFPGPDRLGRMLNIPKREYLWLSGEATDAIEREYERWLMGA